MRALPLLLAALLAAPPPAPDIFPPQQRGDMTARLDVRTAAQGPGPGLARVTYTLTVTGPPGLEVAAPELTDPVQAWKSRPQDSAWALEDGRATWKLSLVLTQVKPGPLPLPAVKLRFRDGPAASWEQAEWTDILLRPRELPLPGAPALPAPAWRAWLPAIILGPAVLVLLAGGWAWRRHRMRRPAPLPADRWALGELDRMQQAGVPAGGGAGEYYTRLSNVVRRYLAERFGLRAPQQTTAEFLHAVQEAPQLTDAQRELLRELLGRCDLVKFARAGTSAEECREVTDLARDFVRQTAPGQHMPA